MTVQRDTWERVGEQATVVPRVPDQRPRPAEPVTSRRPRRRRRIVAETAIVLLADALATLAIVVAARSALPALIWLIAIVPWKLDGLYARRITLSVLDDLPALLAGLLLAAALVTVLALSLDVETVSSLWVAMVASALAVAVVCGRLAAYLVILRQRSAGRISHPTLMMGAGAPARFLVERIQAHPESGLSLVGTVAHSTTRAHAPLPVLGRPDDLAQVLEEKHITDVVIGFGGMSSAELVAVLRTCDRADVDIHVVPRLFEMHHLHGGEDHIWGLPLVRLRRPPQRVATWRFKLAIDKAVAAAALFVALPVLSLVALAVRIELGPGVIFRQTRVGLNGREFDLLKFRSMAPAVAPTGTWTVAAGELGRVGRFIRRYSLDELPQLLNVVRGDMSLVGPRPERPEYVEQFRALVPPYTHRHRVPVGMTGLAAVNGLRGDTSIQDRVHFDNWYIDNWSLWLDMKILIRTVASVLRGTGG